MLFCVDILVIYYGATSFSTHVLLLLQYVKWWAFELLKFIVAFHRYLRNFEQILSWSSSDVQPFSKAQTKTFSCSSCLLPVASSQCYERLHKEKEEVRVSFEESLQKLEEQHKEELVQLEDRCGIHLCWSDHKLDLRSHIQMGFFPLLSDPTLMFDCGTKCVILCLRLRSFYQTEWDKVHQTYQEEADKCRMLMEQQVRERCATTR